MKYRYLLYLFTFLATFTLLEAQNNKKKKKPAPPFRWVNPIPEDKQYPGLHHATFKSPSMDVDVGYCIYLPPGYEKNKKHYPVIYYLHGGRLTVVLNGKTVIENAQLPNVPESGPIALQHHGGMGNDGKLSPASSLMQFRNIFIREL